MPASERLPDDLAGPPREGAAAAGSRPPSSAEILSSLLENPTDAIIAIDEAQRIVAFSQGGERMFGYPRDEVLGQPLEMLLPARFADAHREYVREFIASPDAARRMRPGQVVLARRRDGSEFAAECAVSRWAAHGRTVATAIVRDVSERARAEAEQGVAVRTERLQTLEQLRKLSRAVEQSPAIVVITGTDETIEYVNPRFTEITGFPPGEVLGTKATALAEMLPEDEYRRLLDTLAGGGTWHGEFRARQKNGGHYWEAATVSSLRDSDGRITHYVKVAEDVSDHKRAEEALRQSEARFRRLAENAQDIIYRYRLTPPRGFEYVSPAAAAITGYSPEEHYSDPDLGLKIVHQDDRHMLEEMLRAGGLSGPVVLRWIRKDGRVVWTEQRNVPIYDPAGHVVAVEGIARDITERKEFEAALSRRASELAALNEAGQALSQLADPPEILERLYSVLGTILDNSNLYVALVDEARGRLKFPIYTMDGARRPPTARPFGTGITEYIIRTGKPLWIPRGVPAALHDLNIEAIGREARSFLGVPMIAGGRVFGVIAVQDYEQEDVYTEEHRELLTTFAAQAAIALENARLFEDAQHRATRQEALAAVIAAAVARMPMPDLLSTALDRAVQALEATAGAVWAGALEAAVNLPPGAPTEMAAAAAQAGLTAEERTLVVDDWTAAVGQHAAVLTPLAARYALRATVAAHIRAGGRRIGALAIFRDTPWAWTAEDVVFVEGVARELGDAAERQHAEEKILSQLDTLTSLYAVARKLSQTLDLATLADDVVRTAVGVFGADAAVVGRVEPGHTVRILGQHATDTRLQAALDGGWDETPLENLPTGRVLHSGFPVVEPNLRASSTIQPERVQTLVDAGLRAAASFPLITREHTFGVLGIGSASTEFFTPARVDFFQAYAHLVAAALENARLFAEATRRLERLQALRDIDAAITGSVDARVTVGVFLDKVTTNLRVDAAGLLVVDPFSQTLEFLAGRGFRSSALQHTRLRLGQGYAGRAALERATVSIPDLRQTPGELARAPDLAREAFVAYYAVPLVAKGQVKGVLEIFHRSPLTPDSEWLDFLVTLAGQAAVVLDSAAMLEHLQRANAELTLAYDTTLEGWVRALDLRDKETEGHTQRVTELTLRLARAMGIADEQIVHVRRGALLHDIGKIGIPDSILLKPGPLTDEEWSIMRQHPIYAYELLSPIPYLRPALPIPYAHHEKWNGTGYPRVLKGEEIPLEARIFAVVDVWDAITSDRPYRPRWSLEQARTYIREQAGNHFDPKAVAAFLSLNDS